MFKQFKPLFQASIQGMGGPYTQYTYIIYVPIYYVIIIYTYIYVDKKFNCTNNYFNIYVLS